MSLPSSFFNCKPDLHKAKDLSFWINNKLSLSLLHLLGEVERVVGPQNISFKASFQDISSKNQLHYNFYAFNDFLITAMEHEDLDGIHKIFADHPLTLSNSRWNLHQNITEYNRVLSLFKIDEPSVNSSFKLLEGYNLLEWNLAVEYLELLAPNFSSESKCLIGDIFFCSTEQFKGASSFRFLGSIFLALPKIVKPELRTLYYMEWIIHETAHIYLHILLTEDPFVLNDLAETYTSPLRVDPRPMIQVYHAAFVLSRVLGLFEILLDSNIPDSFKSEIQRKHDDYSLRLDGCFKLLDNKALLTESGQIFLNSMKSYL